MNTLQRINNMGETIKKEILGEEMYGNNYRLCLIL